MCLGIPGRVVALGATELDLATVAFGGATRAVNLIFVPEAREGDYVVVHAGFAISVIDAERAERTLADLRALGEAP